MSALNTEFMQALQASRDAVQALQASRDDVMTNAINFGTHLISLKMAITASEFDRQFAGHEDAVRGALPIKKKRAQAFMRLAKNKALVRQSNWNQLPYDFEAVLALTLVPPDVIERAIADRRINFSMSVADANRLRRQAEWGTAP